MQHAILDQLGAIANEWRWLAAAWHGVILFMLLFALIQHPPQRTLAMLLVLPLLSVSAMAAWAGNPFNAVVFMLFAVLLAGAAMRLDDRRSAEGSPLQVVAGVMLFGFGFLYPHFLSSDARTAYLYMSPFGLLPCPTLAVVSGISLILGAFGSGRWAGTLMLGLLLYGGIGVLVLGVWIDTMLIAATAALFGAAICKARAELL